MYPIYGCTITAEMKEKESDTGEGGGDKVIKEIKVEQSYLS
jgi:hypothetical protein